jgi:hypothetical protein
MPKLQEDKDYSFTEEVIIMLIYLLIKLLTPMLFIVTLILAFDWMK